VRRSDPVNRDHPDPTGTGHDVKHGNGSPRDTSGSLLPSTAGSSAAGSQMTVSPDDLRQFGMATTGLASTVDPLNIDPSLLTDDIVGHAGLGQALRDFVDTFDQRAGDFRAHVAKLADAAQQAGADYETTDDDAADQLRSLEPDDGVPKRRGKR
jgi:hypothetical protein